MEYRRVGHQAKEEPGPDEGFFILVLTVVTNYGIGEGTSLCDLRALSLQFPRRMWIAMSNYVGGGFQGGFSEYTLHVRSTVIYD